MKYTLRYNKQICLQDEFHFDRPNKNENIILKSDGKIKNENIIVNCDS